MLDYDQMAGSRICMSKIIDLSNMLFLAVHFLPTWWMDKKVFKIQDFWFFITWNNLDQLQWIESCIRMSHVHIWVGRIQPRILLEWHKSLSLSFSVCVYIDRLVSFQKDLRPNLSHSSTNIRYLNTRSTPLKLICIISSIYKSKIKCFEYFLLIYQEAQNGWLKVVSWLDLYL